MNKKINKKNKSISEYVHDLIIEVRRPTYMNPFKNPVDPLEIPHYYEVVKNPMDLSTLYQKLMDGKYKLLAEVQADFQLIIDNCELFNPPGTWIRPICDKFKANFEKQWAKLIEKLASKGVDPNQRMTKPDIEEGRSSDLQGLLLAESLGLRTRNQTSIIKDSLNESMHSIETSKPGLKDSGTISIEKSSITGSLLFMEGMKESAPVIEKTQEKGTSFKIKLSIPHMTEPRIKIEEMPIKLSIPHMTEPRIKIEETPIVQQKPQILQPQQTALQPQQTIPQPTPHTTLQPPQTSIQPQQTTLQPSQATLQLPQTAIQPPPQTNFPQPQQIPQTQKIPQFQQQIAQSPLKIEEKGKNIANLPALKIEEKASTTSSFVSSVPKPMIQPPPPQKIEEENEVPNEFLIHLNAEAIRSDFKEYAGHKLRKYKRNVLRVFSKLTALISSLEPFKEKEQNDTSGEFQRLLKESEVVKQSRLIDYPLLSLCVLKLLVWFKKANGKVKDPKTVKRVLAYFSFVLKILRRVSSISKRLKGSGIQTLEEAYIPEESGTGYFRENLQKVQAIFNPKEHKPAETSSSSTVLTNPPALTSGNSIKITLPKPAKERPEVFENPSISSRHPKKPSHLSRPTITSSPSTKIVINKDLNRIKNFSLEKPASVENKSERLFSWASWVNTKIHEKIEGYFASRLQQVRAGKTPEEKQQVPKDEKDSKGAQNHEFIEETPMFEDRKTPIEIYLCPERKSLPKCDAFQIESPSAFDDWDSSFLPTEIISLSEPPQKSAGTRYKTSSFSKLRIERQISLRNPFFSAFEDEKPAGGNQILVEEVNIYTLFKEMDEADRGSFDEMVRGLKRSNNERLRSTKYERIVDKSCKSFFEISQEVSLDKIVSLSLRLRCCERFILEVENVIETSSFELFIDLKRIQKINELNLVENSQWVNLDVLGNKLMKNKLFEALLNQLIKANKYVVDRNAGLYYCIERAQNEGNACVLNLWIATERVADLKLRIRVEKVEDYGIKIENFDVF